MNESEYIRYLLLNQSEHPRSRELEVEIMRLRNEVNKIGVNVNQLVKKSNSHMYSEGDRIKLYKYMDANVEYIETEELVQCNYMGILHEFI